MCMSAIKNDTVNIQVGDLKMIYFFFFFNYIMGACGRKLKKKEGRKE